MDKIVVFGVFEFVGFHLCKGFLEQGYYVQGIHIDTNQDCLLEEKRLEVGRNANFEEQTLKQWRGQKDGEEKSEIMIFPLYDWYMTLNESVVEQETLANCIFQYMEGRREQKDKAVFLLPMQLLADLEGSRELFELHLFVETTRKLIPNSQLIYLPTIYGPWQPPTFLFQKAILKRLNKKDNQTDSVSREWSADAIFIYDILDPLINISGENKTGKFILDSGMENSWDNCADLLKIDQALRRKADYQTLPPVFGQLGKIIPDQLTPAADALLIQQKHFSRLYGNEPG